MRQSKAVLRAVGGRARNLRTERDMRQREVAEALGVDVPAVSRIERGLRDLRLTQAAQMASALGVRLSELVAPADDVMPKPKAVRAIWPLVVADMQARDQLGRERYGVPLQPFNGRDALRDAYEESLDLCAYLRQALYERDGK